MLPSIRESSIIIFIKTIINSGGTTSEWGEGVLTLPPSPLHPSSFACHGCRLREIHPAEGGMWGDKDVTTPSGSLHASPFFT